MKTLLPTVAVMTALATPSFAQDVRITPDILILVPLDGDVLAIDREVVVQDVTRLPTVLYSPHVSR